MFSRCVPPKQVRRVDAQRIVATMARVLIVRHHAVDELERDAMRQQSLSAWRVRADQAVAGRRLLRRRARPQPTRPELRTERRHRAGLVDLRVKPLDQGAPRRHYAAAASTGGGSTSTPNSDGAQI